MVGRVRSAWGLLGEGKRLRLWIRSKNGRNVGLELGYTLVAGTMPVP